MDRQSLTRSGRPQQRCCGWYDFEEKQEDEAQPTRGIFERMPLLSRQTSSNIQFKNIKHNNKQPIYELLSELYETSANPSDIYDLLASKRINPIIEGNAERDDLEYFIPQIITFMVIQKNLADEELVQFIIKGCCTDFYFAHRVYFYLKSLSNDHLGQQINNVCEFLKVKFMGRMDLYQDCKLSGIQFAKSMIQMDYEFKEKQRFQQQVEEYQKSQNQDKADLRDNRQRHLSVDRADGEKYGTKIYPQPRPVNPRAVKKVYRMRYCSHGFMETPKFWDDLIDIGNEVGKIPLIDREQKLNQLLMAVNERLPANVYIPFFKDHVRLYNVLCVWKGRLFATKERAPYSLWLEVYREEEELNLSKVEELEEEGDKESIQKKKKKNILEKIYSALSRPFSISGEKNTLNFNYKRYITGKLSTIDQIMQNKPKKDRKLVSQSFMISDHSYRNSLSGYYEDLMENSNKALSERHSLSQRSSINYQVEEENRVLDLDEFFGGPAAEAHIQEIKQMSIYRNLRSWKLIHLMVKTGDDIKQEQFAMQLINRFQYVFRKEKVDCVVFPYEVISLGPDCGVIEMLNNVTTLSSLFKKIDGITIHNRKMRLRDFFNTVFPNPQQARRNFMRSLAGYSILTYFLQVKDRHNGNILINREGFIIHIDFGFFLSNAPGKGVELEKKVPFKLLSQYAQVIGELKSAQFLEFRKLFYNGFSAVLKHKESFLTLVRMMYSSHGQSMGCFIKGEQAIDQLQQRFSITQGVQMFCYDLINNSLDNWRARWYDKFQYFLQKIYY